MPTAGKPAIRAVLDELDQLAGAADHDALAALRDRLDSARLRVLVAGEASAARARWSTRCLAVMSCRRALSR
jgi:hypothetical protein